MAALDPIVSFRLNLSTNELRLILKALGGRLRDTEVGEAKALGDLLSTQRANGTIHLLKGNERLLENIDKAEASNA